MTLPLIVVRPEPGLATTVAAAEALGLETYAEPLMAIVSRAWEGPDPAEVDGLLLGSANVIRGGGAELEKYRDKPVYAVGEATAEAARAAGFTVAATGSSGLQSLLDGFAGQRLNLLRPAGAARVQLSLPPGITIETRVVYGGSLLPMSDSLAARLGQGAVVVIHSGVTARHLAAECRRREIDRGNVALATMSIRVAAGAGAGWSAVRMAPQPTDAALLALANDMCHGGAASSERG